MPRFSIRVALILLTVGAAVSVVLAAAVRDELWAVGFVIGCLSIPATLVMHVGFYSLVRVLGAMNAAGVDRRSQAKRVVATASVNPEEPQA